jgi:hypothetical protein
VPENAMLAIDYKQQADKTMYGYNPGDSLVNIMSALPKKDRQYFKYFIDAPKAEKNKILRIAPSYLRRALQSVWGMPVDTKPTLNEYFQYHGLPDASWVGWNENTDIDDVKVKLIHKNNLDYGEFDVWDDGRRKADMTNIPVPNINARNSQMQVQAKLTRILGNNFYSDVQVRHVFNNRNQGRNAGNTTNLYVQRDARSDVEDRINNLDI